MIVGLVLAALVAACAAAPPSPALASGACRLHRLARLHVTLRNDLPIIAVRINGRVARLMLDTGSGVTILTTGAARRLDATLDFRHSYRVAAVGATADMTPARLQLVQLGGLILTDRKVAVGSFGFGSPALWPHGEPDGIAGADILSAYDVDLNLPARRLTLYRPTPCPTMTPPWCHPCNVLPVRRLADNRLVLGVRLDGRPLQAALDTGSQLTTITRQAALAVGVTPVSLRGDPSTLTHGTGQGSARLYMQRFGAFTAAGETFRHRRIAVLDGGLPSSDMLLGIDLLKTRRLWLSYATRQVFIAPTTPLRANAGR